MLYGAKYEALVDAVKGPPLEITRKTVGIILSSVTVMEILLLLLKPQTLPHLSKR